MELLMPQFSPASISRREIWLVGEVSEEALTSLISSVTAIMDRSEKEPITIFVHSPGGDVEIGLGIAAVLEALSVPLITVGVQSVHSAAFSVFMAGHIRLAYPNTSFLVHAITFGTYSDLENNKETTRFIDELMNQEAKRLASRTKWPADKWQQLLSGTGTGKFFSLDTMLEAGAVHSVVTYPEVRAKAAEAANREAQPISHRVKG